MTEPKQPNTPGAPEDENLFGRVMPDGLRDRLKHLVGEFKLPRELINYMMSQVDETKHAAVAIVAREVREFLEKTNLSEEIVKVLTRVSFEVTTNIKFLDNEDGRKRGLQVKITRTEPDENSDAEKTEEESDLPATKEPAHRKKTRGSSHPGTP